MDSNSRSTQEKQEFQITKSMWLETYQSAIDTRCTVFRGILSESFKAMFEYSKLAINGAFLLNGSAAATTIYNSYYVGDQWKCLALKFALGAVLAIACAAISYIAQRLYFLNDNENFQKSIERMYAHKFCVVTNEKISKETLHQKNPTLANWVSGAACIFLVASLCLFCYSLYNAVIFAK